MRFNTQRLIYITLLVSLVLGIGRNVYTGWSGMETFFFFYPFDYTMFHLDVIAHRSLVWYEIDTFQESLALIMGWFGLGLILIFPFVLLFEVNRRLWNATKVRS